MTTNTAASTRRRLQILENKLGPARSERERELRARISELVGDIAAEHRRAC